MNEFIEKLIGRLEEKAHQTWLVLAERNGYEIAIEIVNQLAEEYKTCNKPSCKDCEVYDKEKHYCPEWCDVIKNTVKELEENHNGWIPCSERLPETNDAVNITWVNRKPEPYYKDIKDKPFTATGHYHKGKWYWYSCVCKDYLDQYGNSDIDEVDKDIEIIAWQPLPAPYQMKGEQL